MTFTYFKLYVKSQFRNPHLLGWSIGFMLFWLLLGYLMIHAFVEDLQRYGLGPEEITDAGLCYTAGWYASIAVIGLGSSAVSLCIGLYSSSISLRYIAKYSRLKVHQVFLQNVLGYLLICIVISTVLLTATMGLYSQGFNMPMTPKNPLMLYVVLIVTGLFYYVLSSTLVYSIIVARKPRAAFPLSYLPLVLSLGLVLSALNVSLYEINIILPFNAATLLIFHYYTGKEPPITAFKEHEHIVTTSPYLLWLSLALWIVALSITTIVLMKKQRGVGAEEIIAI